MNLQDSTEVRGEPELNSGLNPLGQQPLPALNHAIIYSVLGPEGLSKSVFYCFLKPAIWGCVTKSPGGLEQSNLNT